MTKAIWVLLIVAAGYLAYLLFQQWDKARLEHDGRKAEQAAVAVNLDNLPGMPGPLEGGYRTARGTGARALQAWFATNGKLLADPRKAWIELELCSALARENPAEARKIFSAVKSRVPPSSPVWPRLQELAKTFGE